MEEVKLNLNDKKARCISGSNLAVYHTEVSAKPEGKGFAKRLLNEMVNYVRKNNLEVIPLCPYVHAQFKRHPQEYADLWNKEQENETGNK